MSYIVKLIIKESLVENPNGYQPFEFRFELLKENIVIKGIDRYQDIRTFVKTYNFSQVSNFELWLHGRKVNLNQFILKAWILSLQYDQETHDCHGFIYYLISGKIPIISHDIHSPYESHVYVIVTDLFEGDILLLSSKNGNTHSAIYIGKDKNGSDCYLGKFGSLGAIAVSNHENTVKYLGNEFKTFGYLALENIVDVINFPSIKISLSNIKKDTHIDLPNKKNFDTIKSELI